MSVLKLLTRLKDAALNLLFPAKCTGCGGSGDYICDSCRTSLPSIVPPICEYCGIPLARGNVCVHCQQNSLIIDGIRSLFAFADTVRKAVHELKYNNLKAIAHNMASLIHDYMVANDISGDILVPVPLHRSRLRERGYNQSELICRELAKLCNLPVDKKSLIRTKRTKSQTALNRDQRGVNVEDAFVCKDDTFKDKRVLLIDDVCTTGATLDACAVSLKKKGALTVWGLTFARDL